MKIINVANVEAKEVSMDPLFFGDKVFTQFVLEEEHKAEKIQVVNVKFALGARNKLHTHTTEQILIITEGKGIVATKNQQHTVKPGTTVLVSPDEEHWHDATENTTLTHLSYPKKK